ncbi:MAG: polysaccharide biosynthesis/export family protein [Pseudomonadota bacterium]
MFRLIFAAVLGCAVLTGACWAEAYRIGMGDRLTLFHSGLDDSIELDVDIDGEIRVMPIGGIAVAGLTLNDVEALLRARLSDDGFLVEPLVGLSVLSYAPIVVGGDVAEPGRFAFGPGMTVASALALAGGVSAEGRSETEMARAAAEVAAGLQTANLEIALAVARLARFDALSRDNGDQLVADAQQMAQIPAPQDAAFEAILAREATLLQAERERRRRLLSFWAAEIQTIEAQALNFDVRIDVQQEIVESTLRSLDASQELSDRGLQTGTRLASAEQSAAQARSRVLELEAAKITAARAVSAARRERALFLANQRRDTLIGIQEASARIKAQRYRYDRFLAQQRALTDAQDDPAFFVHRYEIQSTRHRSDLGDTVSGLTPLLPGDMLIVRKVPALIDPGG